jgi:L-asparaginase
LTNILLVFTGGTIGSATHNGTIDTSEKQGYKLVQLFEQTSPNTEQVRFKTIQPLQILSENLVPSAWEALIKAIEAENLAQYDGIIITHGTDTLAYTASALGLYFNNIKKSILLVSSNYPLDHPLANGLNHFNCAVEFIKQRKDAGVFVPYKNPNAKISVHIGTRLASSLQLSSDFISVQSKAYLQFENDTFHQLNPMKTRACTAVQLTPSFSANVLLIKPYPGLDYSHFQLDKVDIIIHDLYHSGTACSNTDWGKNYSLLTFIKKCNQRNIGLYMAPAIKNTDAYSSTRSLIDQGAKMIWNMSIESAYAKLLLAYVNFTDESAIEQFLEHDIAFEHIAVKL